MDAFARARGFAAYEYAADTIPPLRQIVLLYDAALRRVREARRAVEEGRIEDRFRAVEKATAIIDALHRALDFERGGEIASILDLYYTDLAVRLQAINVRNDPVACDEVIARLLDMRTAWAKLAGEGEEGEIADNATPAPAPRAAAGVVARG